MKPSEAGRITSSVPQTVSQIRGIGTAGLAQTRVLNSGIQAIPSVPLSLTSTGSQPAPLKQTATQRTGLATTTTASTITLSQSSTIVATRPTNVSHISTTYHVPRGAAAVANIAAPRSAAVATPISRATGGVAAATHGSSFVSGLRVLGPGTITAPRASSPATSGTTWLNSGAPQLATSTVAVPKAVSPRPRTPIITTIPTFTQGRTTSMTVTAKPITPQVSQPPRPQLLHTTAQKTISGTQLHIAESSYFKPAVPVQSNVSIAQVVPARTQTLTYSSSASPLGAAHFSATAQAQQITLSQGIAGQARQNTVLTATSTQRPTQMTAVLSPPPRGAPPSSPVRLTASTAPSLTQSGTVSTPTRPGTPGQGVLAGTARLISAPVSSAATPIQARLTPAVTTVAMSQLGTVVSAGQTRLVTSTVPTVVSSGSPALTSTRLTVSNPSQIHQSATMLPAQARIASVGMVSLHPAVVSNTSTSIPLKPVSHSPQLVTTTSRTLTGHQTVGPKVIAQPVHPSSIQITQVPVSSVAGKIQPAIQPAALAITTGATRPVTYNTTTTLAGTAVSGIRPLAVATTSTIPVAKVFPQAAPVSEVALQAQAPPQATSVYIQTSHRQSPAPSATQVAVERTSSMLSTYSLPAAYYYEQPSTGYQVATFTPASPYTVQTTTTTTPVPTSAPLRTGGTSHQVQGTLAQQEPPALGQSSQVQSVPKPNASPRPSILRKRDNEGSPMKAQKNLTPMLAALSGPVSPPSPRRPDSRGNGNSSGGSTTISATSSPGLGEAGEDSLPPIKQEPVEEGEKSPRKKPRKQQLHGNELHEPKFSEDEMEFIPEEKIKKEVKEAPPSTTIPTTPEDYEEKIFIPKRPNISLINSYRCNWKSRQNHYLRYSDVKPKDERRPSVTDIANQKQVLQKLNGWKIHHLSTQMEDLADLESQVFEKLAAMLKVMEKKSGGKEQDKDVNRVNELIKGNMQRSKVIKDQMEEAKCQVMKIFDHKSHVTDIISRCANKRSLKKREKS